MRGWAAPLGIAVAGAAMTAAVFGVLFVADRERARQVVAWRAEWRALDLQHKIDAAIVPVTATAILISANLAGADTPESPGVRTRFERFVWQARNPDGGVRAVVWAPRVTAAARAGFETQMREVLAGPYTIADRAPDGARAPAPPRAWHAPAVYEAVFVVREGRFGIDMAADAAGRAAAERARDSARPVVAPQLDQDPADPGVRVFVPVYLGGEAPDAVAQRRALLRGFVIAEVALLDLLAEATRHTPPMLGSLALSLRWPDDPTAAPGLAAHWRDGAGPTAADAALPMASDPAALHIERSFAALGAEWVLRFDFPPGVVGALRSNAPFAFLAAGLLLTALLAAHARRQYLRRDAVETLVTERTGALQAANESLQREIGVRRTTQDDLARTAEELTAVLDAAPFAVVVVDAERQVRAWNAAAERMFGYTAAEIIGTRGTLIVPGEEEPRVREFAAVTAGRPLRNVTARRRRKDGRVIEVVYSAERLVDRDGSVRGVVGIMEDMTERRLLEEQLRQTQKMEALGTLTGGLAHDLNNMLTVIIGNLDLLADRIRHDPESAELARAALDAGLRGSDLNHRLLAFARRQPLEPRRVVVNDLVSGMTRLLARVLGEAIEVRLETAADLWPAEIDPAQLEASVANLATNARDAMAGGGRLTIATRNAHLDTEYAALNPGAVAGDYVLIEVSDTGHGIPAETLVRVFEPFFTTKRAGRGTGLGLSMVFGFVKQSGGHIKVYSEVGHGTTVRMYLPRAQAAAGPEAGSRAENGTLAARCNEAILVVDDNDEVRRAVERQLRELGYRVFSAPNGRNALAALDREPQIDLLLTDVVMPGGLSGPELAAQARARRPQLKVLFMSGFPSEHAAGGESGIPPGRLLSKPYRKEDLARKVREILDAPHR